MEGKQNQTSFEDSIELILLSFFESLKGNFIVKKTRHTLSAIAIDQAYRQTNPCVKGDGDDVCLKQNSAVLRRWMMAGQEMARVIGEFEALVKQRPNPDSRHHEQTKYDSFCTGYQITGG